MFPPLTVIFLWPLAMMGFFKRFSLPVALCTSIIAGHLLLPSATGYNLPVLPTIDKASMPSLAAIIILMILINQMRDRREVPSYILPGWLPRNPTSIIFIGGIVLGAFATILTNGDRLVYGFTVLPDLKPYDGFSAVLTAFITLLPFFLGRKILGTAEGHKTLLFVLCIAGLLYSLPTLWEVRMSPRLNVTFYGFFPNSWSQHIRNGGYRPLVFLKHGLYLGIFISGTVLAIFGYSRIAKPEHKKMFFLGGLYLLVVLVLAKALGALLITLVLIPLVLLFSVRIQAIAAACIAGMVLFYPALRGTSVIPTEQVVSLAESIDPIRALSLQYRLGNEDILMAKANERPFFGWGPRGRARVYDDKGEDISTTDGSWIIAIGSLGWVGYLSRFGLLAAPAILLGIRRRKYDVTLPTSLLSLVLVGNLIDLIPNSGLTPVTWLMAGALMGFLERPKSPHQAAEGEPSGDSDEPVSRHSTAPRNQRGPATASTPAQGPQYSRFPRKNDAPNRQDK